MVNKKPDAPKWLVWLIGWLFLFGIITYGLLGPVQQSSFSGEVDTEKGSVKIGVETEDDETLLKIMYGLFGSGIIVALIWGIVKIYEIKSRKKAKPRK